MSILEAVLLGIVQGLTEFLPISSTAHLTLVGKLLGLVDLGTPAAWTGFIAVMQLGTLASVVLYFFGDLRKMSTSLLKDIVTHGTRWELFARSSKLALYVALGTIPVVIVGLLFSEIIEGVFTKSTGVIAGSLVGLAILLWAAERWAVHGRSLEELKSSDAVVIGVAQALALVPGSSRSGTTITAALFLGFARSDAARFSFLLSIPSVFASGIYEMSKIDTSVFQLGVANLVIATVVSSVAGYAAIGWLLRYLATRTTYVFVWYRVILGVSLLVMLFLGLIS